LRYKGATEIGEAEIDDTQLMAHVSTRKVPKSFLEKYESRRMELNAELPKGRGHRKAKALSLKVLAPYFLKVPPFWENPLDHNDEVYNQKDCEYTLRLREYFLNNFSPAEKDFYENKMLPWSAMLRRMESKGICISFTKLDEVENEYREKESQLRLKLEALWADAQAAYTSMKLTELKAKYDDMCQAQIKKGRDEVKTRARYKDLHDKAAYKSDTKINFDSPKQMVWLLRDFLGLDITKIDDEEEESTGKAVLNQLAAHGREDISTYLDWREAQKVLTMYLPTYREKQINGVIHPNFHLTGTRTGRLSSSNPNLQQVPSKLYKIFKPRPLMKFVTFDLSGIEAALIALYSGDKRLFEILAKGESIHDHNATILFGLDCEISEVKKKFPKERQCAKNLGFATFYGAGWRRLRTVFLTAGFDITEQEAKRKLQALKNAYPNVFEFHKEITEIFESGEVMYNLMGRPLVIPDKEDCYMKGFNTLIQSSASDLCIRACQRAEAEIKEQDLHAYPLLLIHDCVLMEAYVEDAKRVAEILRKAMTDFRLKVDEGIIQLQVEGGISDEWEK